MTHIGRLLIGLGLGSAGVLLGVAHGDIAQGECLVFLGHLCSLTQVFINNRIVLAFVAAVYLIDH